MVYVKIQFDENTTYSELSKILDDIKHPAITDIAIVNKPTNRNKKS